MLGRLRASERLRAHVAALTRHHLRLGFLVRDVPLDRRAEYRYLEACEPVAADVTLLSVADRLATRGRKADVAIERHLELARQLLAAALDRRDAGNVAPLVRGDELAARGGHPARPAARACCWRRSRRRATRARSPTAPGRSAWRELC